MVNCLYVGLGYNMQRISALPMLLDVVKPKFTTSNTASYNQCSSNSMFTGACWWSAPDLRCAQCRCPLRNDRNYRYTLCYCCLPWLTLWRPLILWVHDTYGAARIIRRQKLSRERIKWRRWRAQPKPFNWPTQNVFAHPVPNNTHWQFHRICSGTVASIFQYPQAQPCGMGLWHMDCRLWFYHVRQHHYLARQRWHYGASLVRYQWAYWLSSWIVLTCLKSDKIAICWCHNWHSCMHPCDLYSPLSNYSSAWTRREYQ